MVSLWPPSKAPATPPKFSNHTLKRDTEYERENQGVGSWHRKRARRPRPPGWLSCCFAQQFLRPSPSAVLPAPASALSLPTRAWHGHPPPAVLTALQEAVVFVDSLSPDTEGSELATKSSVSRAAPASEWALHKCWLNEWEAGRQGGKAEAAFPAPTVNQVLLQVGSMLLFPSSNPA